MSVIWAYLLGISRLLSGTFSPMEIAMTIIVGVAAAIGIASFVRSRSFLSPLSAGGLFVMMAALQVLCFRLSFLPAIAHR
jgi:hypothetical protein